MIDILSLPRRNKVSGNPALLKMISSYKTGLPINSLPGWELIPLNCKLPMLKCPGNQVIFSKNKIGQSVSGSDLCRKAIATVLKLNNFYEIIGRAANTVHPCALAYIN